MDFTEQAKERFDELSGLIQEKSEEVDKLKNEQKALKAYLTSVGVFQKQRRKRRTKAEMAQE